MTSAPTALPATSLLEADVTPLIVPALAVAEGVLAVPLSAVVVESKVPLRKEFISLTVDGSRVSRQLLHYSGQK